MAVAIKAPEGLEPDFENFGFRFAKIKQDRLGGKAKSRGTWPIWQACPRKALIKCGEEACRLFWRLGIAASRPFDKVGQKIG